MSKSNQRPKEFHGLTNKGAVIMATATSTVSTDAAAGPSRLLTIRDQLRSPALLQQIAMVVPKHLKPERMVRVALTAITRTPDLANCDQESFFRCLMDLSQWGLEPDGRHAHLIPRWNSRRNRHECTMVIDYKGYVRLAYQSNHVKTIHADVVRKGDIFRYNRGEVVEHVPWFLRTDDQKPESPGEIIAAYSFVRLNDGAEKSEVLSRDEVDGIRKRSPAGGKGPWVSDYSEMSKKTAFRRVSKWIPLSAEVVEAFERDDDRFQDFHTGDRVVAAKDLDALTDRLMAPRSDCIDVPSTDGGNQGESPADEMQMSAEEQAEMEQLRLEQEACGKGGKQKIAFEKSEQYK